MNRTALYLGTLNFLAYLRVGEDEGNAFLESVAGARALKELM